MGSFKEEINIGLKTEGVDVVSRDFTTLQKQLNKLKEEMNNATKSFNDTAKNSKSAFALIDKSVKTTNSNINIFKGGLQSLTKVPINPVTAGISALGAAIVMSYNGSEKFRESVERTKKGLSDLASNSGVFRTMGDSIGVIVNGFADMIDNINIMNGTSLKKTIEELNKVHGKIDDINKGFQNQMELALKIGYSEEEILNIKENQNMAVIRQAQENKDSLADIYEKANEKYNQAVKAKEKFLYDLEHDVYTMMEFENDVTGELLAKRLAELDKAIELAGEELKAALEAYRKNNETFEKGIEEAKNIRSSKAASGKRSEDKKDKTFEERINDIQGYRDAVSTMNEGIYEDSKKLEGMQLENHKRTLQEKIQLGQSALKQIIENGGKITDPSIKSVEELQQMIITWQKELNNIEGPDKKPLEDYEKHLKSIVNSAASIGSSISNMAFSLAKNGLKDISVVLVLGLDINFVSNNSIIKE